MDAYAFAGRYDDARALGDRIAVEVPDAPELEYRRAVLAKLGTPAIELEGVSAWSGVAGTSLDRMRGRVVALCFFMTKSIPCARTLEWLSRLESDMAGQGLTVWGLSKAYKSAKGAKTLDWETKYINRYRENPAAVIREELGLDESEVGDASDQQMWTELGRPIRSTIGLTQGFENHRAYLVRRVPCVVIIDKDGKIRLIIEAGQPEGGFQTRLIENMLRQLANS